jgi:hypothetical protein
MSVPGLMQLPCDVACMKFEPSLYDVRTVASLSETAFVQDWRVKPHVRC